MRRLLYLAALLLAVLVASVAGRAGVTAAWQGNACLNIVKHYKAAHPKAWREIRRERPHLANHLLRCAGRYRAQPQPPAPVPPPPPEPVSYGGLWAQKGAWAVYGVSQNRDNPAWHEAFATKLHDAGFRWLAVPLHAGMGLSEWAASHYGVLSVYPRHGITVVGWGALAGSPEDQARLVSRTLASHPLFKGYIANAEFGYISNWPNPIPDASRRFVETLAASGVGNVELALSTVIAAPPWNNAGVFDYKPWLAHGWHLLPQAYLNNDSRYTTAWAEQHSLQVGFPIWRVHPTFGIYSWDGWPYVPLSEYLRVYRAGHDSVGWNLFVGDQLNAADWAAAKEG